MVFLRKSLSMREHSRAGAKRKSEANFSGSHSVSLYVRARQSERHRAHRPPDFMGGRDCVCVCIFYLRLTPHTVKRNGVSD